MTQILNEVRLHDQKVDFKAEAFKASQDRMASTLERLADTADALRSIAASADKRNGEGLAAKVNAKNIAWLVGLALMAGIALGSGNEVATLILHRLLGK